jgi:hypothetical protein
LSRNLVLRSALVAVALFALAWLAVGLRASRLEAQGREVVEQAQRGQLSRAEVSEGLDTLRRARRFNADQEPRIAEVALLTEAGRNAEATALAQRITQDEPDNIDGWVVVYLGAVLAGDDARRERALDALDDLNPQLAERLSRDDRERP